MSVLHKFAIVFALCPILTISEPQVPPTQQQYGASVPANLPPVPSPSYGPPGHKPGTPIGLDGGSGPAGAPGGAGGAIIAAGVSNQDGVRGSPSGAPRGSSTGFGNVGGAQGVSGAGFGNVGGTQGVSGFPPGLSNQSGARGNGGSAGPRGAARGQGVPSAGIGFPGGVRGNVGGTGFGNNQGGPQGSAGASRGSAVSGIVAGLGSMAASALGSVSDGIRNIEGNLGSVGGVPGSIRGVLQNAGGTLGNVASFSSNVGDGLVNGAANYGGDANTQCRNKDPNANKQLVMNFYQEIFGNKNEEALEKYVAPDMINHNPMSTNGIEGLRQMLAGPFGQGPPVKIQFMRVAADEDLVWTHVKLPVPAIGMTFAAVDIFRINCQGLIQEHWDVLQGINVQTMNPRPFF